MNFSSLLQKHRDFFRSRATRPVDFRLDALKRLAAAIEKHEAEILAGLHKDLHKPVHEAYSADIAVALSEIAHAVSNVRRWVRQGRRRSTWMAWPSRAEVVPEPRGVALIMGPWNYPFQLVLVPLIGAIAAGNCAVVKPSELAPNSAQVIADIVREAFDERHVSVVQGDADTSRALLAEKFDYIFYTGGGRVGREVMSAAARHLTPVTLELGGKSPCIVCDDAPLEVTARRIIWGKMMNAGQTCVAPDYVLVSQERREPLIAALKSAITAFYTAEPKASSEFARIINRQHFDRLTGYLKQGTVVAGGETDAGQLYIAPTLLTDVSPDSAVMTEEIFGPILPILCVADLDEALRLLQTRPDPLAAYVFTSRPDLQQRVKSELRAGGLCINDVVLHMLGKELPFGGLGESGMGSCHGKASFDAFTHYKSVLCASTKLDLSFRYPPVKLGLGSFKRVMKFLLK